MISKQIFLRKMNTLPGSNFWYLIAPLKKFYCKVLKCQYFKTFFFMNGGGAPK